MHYNRSRLTRSGPQSSPMIIRAGRRSRSIASSATERRFTGKKLKSAHYPADKGEPQNETTHFFGVDDMSPVVATEPMSARLTPTVTRGATIRPFTQAITIATVWPECLSEALAQLFSHQELIQKRQSARKRNLKRSAPRSRSRARAIKPRSSNKRLAKSIAILLRLPT
jgi:hypothetical protein